MIFKIGDMVQSINEQKLEGYTFEPMEGEIVKIIFPNRILVKIIKANDINYLYKNISRYWIFRTERIKLIKEVSAITKLKYKLDL